MAHVPTAILGTGFEHCCQTKLWKRRRSASLDNRGYGEAKPGVRQACHQPVAQNTMSMPAIPTMPANPGTAKAAETSAIVVVVARSLVPVL